MRPISYESTRRGFTRSHQRGRFRLLKPFIFAASIAVIGLVGFFITRFDIQTVEVRGAQFVDPEYVRSEVSREIKKHSPMFGANLIFFNKKGIEESLKPSIAVESLTFDRKFPHTLVVVLHEYRPAAFWATSGFTQEPVEEAEGRIPTSTDQLALNISHLYLLDDKGVVRQEWIPPTVEGEESTPAEIPLLDQPKILAEKSLRNLPVIFDISGTPTSIGGAVLFDAYLANIQDYQNAFSSKNFSFQVEYFAFPSPNSPGELRVMTDKGFWLYLTKGTDWAQIAQNLETAFANQKISGKNISYIDLRIADRIFFK